MKDEWCRHYNGVGNSDTCAAGIEYESVRDSSVTPYRWPCIHSECRANCSRFEGYTQVEKDERNRKISEYLQRIVDFENHDTNLCPHCGAVVEELKQVGRCVYTRPCGCRLWQGSIPETWKAAANDRAREE